MDPTIEPYGGVWLTGQKFQINIKCIIIGLLIASIYALPKQAGMGNLYMIAFIFCMSYIAISIYDKMYRCEAHLLDAARVTTVIFKPQDVSYDKSPLPKGVVLAQDQELAYRDAVYSTHALLIAPLIIISSALAIHAQKREFDRTGVSDNARSYSIHPVVLGLGFLAFFYHSARMIWPRDACKFQSTK
jgi:hypothetical protein